MFCVVLIVQNGWKRRFPTVVGISQIHSDSPNLTPSTTSCGSFYFFFGSWQKLPLKMHNKKNFLASLYSSLLVKASALG